MYTNTVHNSWIKYFRLFVTIYNIFLGKILRKICFENLTHARYIKGNGGISCLTRLYKWFEELGLDEISNKNNLIRITKTGRFAEPLSPTTWRAHIISFFSWTECINNLINSCKLYLCLEFSLSLSPLHQKYKTSRVAATNSV